MKLLKIIIPISISYLYSCTPTIVTPINMTEIEGNWSLLGFGKADELCAESRVFSLKSGCKYFLFNKDKSFIVAKGYNKDKKEFTDICFQGNWENNPENRYNTIIKKENKVIANWNLRFSEQILYINEKDCKHYGIQLVKER